MRRYHHSPSIPFLIARVDGVQEAIGASQNGLNASGGTVGAPDHQRLLETPENGLRAFLWSLWIAGLAIGGGLALELNGMMYQGLWSQSFGFFVAGVAVILHPGEGENHE